MLEPDGASQSTRRLTVMVTGGTGFVGFHTARALVDQGHEVRLLVRSAEKLKRVFEPFGMAGLPHVVGDITNQGAVDEALDGCDAVFHCAAMVSIHAEDAKEVLDNNLRGTRLVLGGAAERGIDRMVQVSSTTALFRPGAKRIDEHAPLGSARTGYGRSKVECDRYVRELQAEGAPIYTTYPGSVVGPDDPGLSEGMLGLKLILEAGALLETTSGIQIVDVRDLARAHVGLLERGGPPGRYPMGGHFLRWSAYGDLLAEIIDKSIPRFSIPRAAYQFFGRMGDFVGQYATLDVPLTAEATRYATEWVETDDRHIKQTLGFEYRDLRNTLYESIFWLQGMGHVQKTFRIVR